MKTPPQPRRTPRPPAPRRTGRTNPQRTDAERPKAPADSSTSSTDTQQRHARGVMQVRQDRTKKNRHATQEGGGAPTRRASRAPEVSSTLRALRRPTGQGDAVDVFGGGSAEAQASPVERIDELLGARRRGQTRTVIQVIGAAAVILGIVWVVFLSPLFAIDASRIVVSGGNERLSNEQVAQKLSSYQGVTLTRLRLASVEQELMEIPQIKSAVVERAWPIGLNVSVTMREPSWVEKADQGFHVLDNEGVTIQTVSESPQGLPSVVLPTDPQLRAQAAQDIATVASALPEGLRANVVEWRSESHQISMTFIDGRVAKWGTADSSDLKGKVLPLLIEQRPAKIYDVSSPTAPVTSES